MGDIQSRLVEHALGETEVPKDPKRVVDLAGGAGVDRLLTLGIVPVGSWVALGEETGAPRWFGDVEWPVEARAEDIENVGTAEEVSVEEVAAIRPDLIIGYDYSFDRIYGELSRVAPSVGITPTNGPEWKESFRKTATVVGREDRYERWLGTYEGRLDELRSGSRAGEEPSRCSGKTIPRPCAFTLPARNQAPSSRRPGSGRPR